MKTMDYCSFSDTLDDLEVVDMEDMGFPTYNHGDGSVCLERRDKAGDFTPENCCGQRIDTSQQERAATKFTTQIAEGILVHRRAGTTLSELAREYGSTQGFISQICSNKRRQYLE